jgi:ATP-dependent Clp protease ATP-binding subunit ClpC
MRANFTPRCQEILSLAKKIALKFFHSHVLMEHLLLSFIKVDNFLIPNIEKHVGANFSNVEMLLIETLNSIKNQDSKFSGVVEFSKEVSSCIDYAYNISNQYRHSYVSVEHVFYAMLNDLGSNAIDYLVSVDIDIVKIQDLIENLLSQDLSTYAKSLPHSRDEEENIDGFSISGINGQQKSLDLYGTNLNFLAKEGSFDFLSPNMVYMEKLEQTLCRKTKSCPLLVGDAGVGKSALIESLAKRIVSLECNDYLISKTVISLDLPAMVAGTKYRGQFEERLKNCIEEIQNDNHIILFIDEIHTLVGAGNSEGALDAANILKPYIARGEITCIGATTHEEYRKTFGKDAALKRRFNVIKIKEPTESEAVDILCQLAPSYASFHNVGYEIDSITEAVKLSSLYINGKQLPDKAIDLIDQAGAQLKIKHYKKPALAKKMEKVLTSDSVDKKTKNEVYENYKKLMTNWGQKKGKNLAIVKPIHIRKILSENLSIPIECLNETYSDKLIKLENRMSRDVVGQMPAIKKISNSLFRSHCGLKDLNRPIGSFLFLGKTGVGKTLTSKSLAKHYFGSNDKLIYFDMSEFTESTSVSKFSGSAPGYVGFDQGGILTEKVKKEPHSVLLFDEIEKAHPTVLQSLLQILEEGRMTDNSGEETCFKNTIIILTSNLGAELIDKQGSVGFYSNSDSKSERIFNEAKKQLSPELVNRFDGIVLFNDFTDKDLNKIINIEISKLKSKLKKKNISLKISKNVKSYILEQTIKENLGGRPIRRLIQNELEVSIAKYIIYNPNVQSLSIKYQLGEFLCNEDTNNKK